MKTKLTGYAKLLVARKYYPKQIQIAKGHVKNPTAALWAQVRKGI